MSDDPLSAALGVMGAHITALNAREEQALAKTLHFPHIRLSGSDLKIWQTPESYFSDFRARAGAAWSHSSFDDITPVHVTTTKVHLDARVMRFDADGAEISSFRSIWVITLENGSWAAKLRSSLAAR